MNCILDLTLSRFRRERKEFIFLFTSNILTVIFSNKIFIKKPKQRNGCQAFRDVRLDSSTCIINIFTATYRTYFIMRRKYRNISKNY